MGLGGFARVIYAMLLLNLRFIIAAVLNGVITSDIVLLDIF